MSRRPIYDKDTSTSKTQLQYPNMGFICRPSKVLQRIQSCTTRLHIGKIWRSPKTMLSNQTHVRQKRSQDHHGQDWDIHRLQSGCQTKRQHGPSTISFPYGGLCQNTRIQVNKPGTKKIPIFTQRQPTKINWKNSEPQTRQLYILHAFWYLLCALCRLGRICFWIQDQHLKINHPPLWPLCSVWPQNAHWYGKKILKNWMHLIPAFRFLSTHKRYPSLNPLNQSFSSRKIKWEIETHMWGRRIYQMQRRCDHQNERSIFRLHQ